MKSELCIVKLGSLESLLWKTPVKFRVPKGKSKEIQKELFSLGVYWKWIQGIQPEDVCPFMFLREGLGGGKPTITHSYSPKWFNEDTPECLEVVIIGEEE